MSSSDYLEVAWKYEDVPAPNKAEGDEHTTALFCFACAKAFVDARVFVCAKCGVARYCGRECQVRHWKQAGHKFGCDRYKLLGTGQELVGAAATREVVERLASSVRLYICPFAVQNHSELEARREAGGSKGHAESCETLSCAESRGFVLIQSASPLAELALPAPTDCRGRALPESRMLLMHYATLADFEGGEGIGGGIGAGRPALVAARPALVEALTSHDPSKEVVVLCHFGPPAAPYTAVLVSPLLQMAICLALATDYAGKDSVQLNLDDL